MAPTKNDAFADLFKTAHKNSGDDRNLSLEERQRRQRGQWGQGGQGGQSGPYRQSESRPGESLNNGMSKISLLSPSPMDFNGNLNGYSSGKVASQIKAPANIGNGMATDSSKDVLDDPFAIFETQKYSNNKKNEVVSVPSGPGGGTPAAKGEISLLDDDFTDLFPSKGAEGGQTATSLGYGNVRNDPPLHFKEKPAAGNYRSGNHDPNESSSIPHFNSKTSNGSRLDQDSKDQIVAELIDIGFSTSQANAAIDNVGLDLQACVNFIMDGGKKQKKTGASGSNLEGQDLGLKLNNLSTDLFSRASTFFNKSKETIMKNIEHLQDQPGSLRQEGHRLPEWMKNQRHYKSEALERKTHGHEYEDYGSDEENIDVDAINQFLKEQKLKDKARNNARLDGLKQAAKNKIRGTSSPQDTEITSSNQETRRKPPTSTSAISAGSTAPKASRTPKASIPRPESKPKPVPQPAEQVDLLGMGSISGLSSGSSTGNGAYKSYTHKFNKGNLNQIEQSDFDTAKKTATECFKVGDYDGAGESYVKCLSALPPNHEQRIVIHSNLAITLIKSTNFKQAKNHCDQGLALLSEEDIVDTNYLISDQTLKSWFVKLLSRKAECLEMLENFQDAYACYMDLISKYGMTDKKLLESKRRIYNILNPPQPKPQAKVHKNMGATVAPNSSQNENLARLKKQNEDTQKQEDLKLKLHDQVQHKLFNWSNGKEDNLRTLLMSLPDVIPPTLNFPFTTTKRLTINDLMLPKKVKINYMKVISSIHPDKLGQFSMEDKMICEGVFIILNKSWDTFKQQNGIN